MNRRGLALVLAAAAALSLALLPRRSPARPLADAPSPAPLLADFGCTSCHAPETARVPAIFAERRIFVDAPPAGHDCAGCHRNNADGVRRVPRPTWLPFSDAAAARIAREHPYLGAPDLGAPLAFAGAHWSLQRFSARGLARFLAAPIPRHAGHESMFPVPAARIDALVSAAGLEDWPLDAEHGASDASIARGRARFAELCAGCHAAPGMLVAPRLRLGVPLLARVYFEARVRTGSGGALGPVHALRWEAAGDVLAPRAVAAEISPNATMPALSALAADDVEALYAYVSTDASDVPAAAARDGAQLPRDAWSHDVGIRVFRQVTAKVFDGGCKHCHDARPAAGAAIERAFGQRTDVEFPTSGRGPASRTPALTRALSPARGCTPAPIVRRLWRRHDEWSGRAKSGDPPGMPLTRAPLDPATIRLVEAWTQHGCPSDGGDLCDACASDPYGENPAGPARGGDRGILQRIADAAH
jgi:mono/diheme cytochrome c family protein